MYLLDTDHLSIMRRESDSAYGTLVTRLSRLSSRSWATTIVTFQEQTQGWLAYLNRARSSDEIISAYEELQAMHESFVDVSIVPFDGKAQEHFETLRQQKVRIGTLDLRIACIALARDAVLLTRNLRDFEQVPGLKVEDWTTE